MTATDPVVAAIHRLGSAAASQLDAPDSWETLDIYENWARDPTDRRRWLTSTPSTRSLHPRVLFRLEKTPEWAAAVRALTEDPTLGKVVDQLVGDAMSATAVQTFGLIAQALRVWADRRTRQRRLPQLIDNWRAFYGKSHVDVQTLRIVTGLSIGRALPLTSRISLRSMTDAEVASALAVGAIAPMPRFRGLVFLESPTCIAYTERMRLRIGSDVDLGAAESYWKSLEVNEEAAVSALRLVGFDRFKLGPRIRHSGGGGVSWSGAPQSDFLGGGRAIQGAVRGRLRELSPKVLAALEKQSGLALALRRFSQSFEPRHEQDRFLDLWIAMESLFGSQSTTEVTFRISLNAANEVSIAHVPKRDVFGWVQKCYGIRSKLVHGARPSMRGQRRLDGTAAQSINALSDDLSVIVRRALTRRLAAGLEPDWLGYSLRG